MRERERERKLKEKEKESEEKESEQNNTAVHHKPLIPFGHTQSVGEVQNLAIWTKIESSFTDSENRLHEKALVIRTP